MADKQVRFDIDVDAAKAEQGLRQFSRAVKRATKESEDGLDDTATAADKVAKALSKMAQQMDSELRQAAKAADALGQALGPELTGSMDVQQITADLNRMGLSFEDIEAEADTLAASLREIDGIRVSQVSDGLDDMRTKMDGVRNSSDQSRSVLANMAGNAAQDLGELGGVVGTLGVGIGQLAEYATEGNIGLSSLAKVAGPMAGLAAATLLVQQYMQGVAAVKAFNADQVEDFADAMRDAGSAVDVVRDAIIETGKIEFSDESGIFGMSAATDDLIPQLAELGLSFEQFMQLVTVQSEHGSDAMGRLLDTMLGLAPGEIIAGDAIFDLVNAVEQYAGNIENAEKATAQYNRVMGESAPTIQDLNRALLGLDNTQRQMEHNWGIILDDLRDGKIDTQNAAEAWSILQNHLKLSNDEMTEMADQKLNEMLEEEADAAKEAAEAQREHAEAIREAALATAEATATINEALAETPDLAGALAAELDEVDKVFDGLVFDESFAGSLRTALDELDSFGPDLQTLADEWADILEGEPINLYGNVRADDAEFLEKIGNLRNLFQEGVVNEFEQGGAAAADTFAQSVAAQIAASTGLDIAEVYRLMGLPPDGSIQTLIQPTIDEAATAKAAAILDALTGTSDDPRIAQIKIALLTGDLDPEIAALAAQLLAYELGIGVKPTVNEQTTQAEIDEAQAYVDAHPVAVPVEFTIPDVIADIGGLFGDDAPTVPIVAELDDDAAQDDLGDLVEERTAEIAALATNVGPTGTALDTLAMPTDRGREAKITAIGQDIPLIDAALDTLANPSPPRKAIIHVDYLDYEVLNVETILEQLAKDRTATIHVRTSGSGGSGGGGGPTPEPALALMGVEAMTAPAVTAVPAALSISPVTQTPTPSSVSNTTVNVRAGAFTSRFDIQRTVARALRQSQRLNGRRTA